MDSVISSARTTSATVVQPEGWPRPKGYANGMLAEGRVLVTGGVIGWNEHGVFAPDFAGQAAQVFANIRAILAAGGAGPEHLVRLTWYVVDMDEYTANLRVIGKSYREIFGRALSGDGRGAGRAAGRACGTHRDRGDGGAANHVRFA